MANDYQKINTLFLRDENNIIIPTALHSLGVHISRQ